MPIPYFESSGRRPHVRRIRADGWRELLLSKGWTMRGAFSEKHIRRRLVVVTILEKHDAYFLCQFQLKDDLWADVTAASREREAAQRRGAFKVVPDTFREAADSDSVDSELEEDDAVIGIGLTFSSPREMERVFANGPAYSDDDGDILANRIVQSEAKGLLLDPEWHECLAQASARCLQTLRAAVPDVEHINPVPDYEAGVLMVALYQSDVETFLSGAYRNRNGDPRCAARKFSPFNALADRLGLWRVDFHGEWMLELRFRAHFSVTHAIAAFEELSTVVYAEVSPEYMENCPDIAMATAESDLHAVAVRGAYNERTFRTTSRRYRFFLVSDKDVTQLSSKEASCLAAFRTAVADRPWRRRLRWPANSPAPRQRKQG